LRLSPSLIKIISLFCCFFLLSTLYVFNKAIFLKIIGSSTIAKNTLTLYSRTYNEISLYGYNEFRIKQSNLLGPEKFVISMFHCMSEWLKSHTYLRACMHVHTHAHAQNRTASILSCIHSLT
jgi:hypothetical protein